MEKTSAPAPSSSSTSSVDELLSCSFLILDKPRGPSSHEVTTYLRKLLGVKKVGQMGTLDPKVSGVIIVGIGKAVRLLRFVDTEKKTYVGVMRTRRAPENIAEIQSEFDKFVGKITQVPPMSPPWPSGHDDERFMNLGHEILSIIPRYLKPSSRLAPISGCSAPRLASVLVMAR